MEPLRCASMPMIARMVVVLPAPLRPSRVTTSRVFTSNVMPCRMWLSPYQPWTSWMASCASAMPAPLACAHVGLDYLRVVGDLRVAAFGQYLAAREHRDP